MKIEIKIADLAKLDAALQTVAGDVARLAVAGEQVEVLRQIAEQNFRTEAGRPAPWPPLAESTIAGFSDARRQAQARREKQAARLGKGRADPRPLIDNAVLMRSRSVQNATPLGAELVSSTDYAGYHQFGSVKRPGRPPARPFVPVTGAWGGELAPTPAAEKRMRRAGEDALRAAAERAGSKVGR
jgi:phage gpG-like protein